MGERYWSLVFNGNEKAAILEGPKKRSSEVRKVMFALLGTRLSSLISRNLQEIKINGNESSLSLNKYGIS